MLEDDEIIGAAEVALIRGADRRTVLRDIHAGLLTPIGRAPGSRPAYLFRRSDIEALGPRRDRRYRSEAEEQAS